MTSCPTIQGIEHFYHPLIFSVALDAHCQVYQVCFSITEYGFLACMGFAHPFSKAVFTLLTIVNNVAVSIQ